MRIRWTKLASQDFTSICDFISEQGSPAAARRVALAIYERISSLSQFPRQGRPGRREGTRELVFSELPYIVIYRVRQDVIEINRILHGSQNWP